MEDLAKKKRVRGGHRSSAKKLVAKIVETLQSASPDKDLLLLRQSQTNLKEKIKKIRELDEQIIDIISASKEENVDDLVTQEIEESDNGIAELEKVLLQLDDELCKLRQSTALSGTQNGADADLNQSHLSTSSNMSVGKLVRAKLPKLELRKFNGKICEWQEFWDGFSSSIDNNEQLSDVDKFAYLRGLLEEPAKSTIAGFSLTETNYKSAVELLKKRFDKKSAVQRAHVNELIQLSPVSKERDTRALRSLYNSCEAHNRALKGLGVSEESYSSIVVPVIVEKLPESFRLTITRRTDFLQWTMEELLDAFVKELELREAHDAVGTTAMASNVERDQHRQRKNPHTAAALLANEKRRNPNCAFCLKQHAHEDCPEVKDPKTRKSLARKFGRCFKCLVKGHRANSCSVSTKCKNCNGTHHVALCYCDIKSNKEDTSVHEEISKDISKQDPNVSVNHHINLHVGIGGLVALQTARGVLRGEREAKVRVLFDAGSHRSFVTSRAAGLVNPKCLRRELLGINTFGQKCAKSEQRDVVELKLKPLDGNKVIPVEAYVVPEISSIQNAHVELARKEYQHLKGTWFSDVCSQEVLEIDVLIGADYLWQFQTGVTKRGRPDDPVAVETELGWVLSGPLRARDLERVGVAQVNFVGCPGNQEWDNDSLESNVQKLWSLEGLGIVDEDSVHGEFLDGITFTGSRYSVKLPWKVGNDKLSDNYRNSLARMKSQLRRLKKEPELLKEYDAIIRDQAEKGIIEQVSSLEKADKVHYLPHQAVIRKAAVTTKVRIVYDASSKESKSGTSLNDCLHVGPSLNPLLYSILIRFREKRIVVVGDIEKAFLNVEVDKADRDSLRFLWVKDVENEDREMLVYRFCRVVFGLNSSPFLLNATLRHHVSKYIDEDPEFVRKMLEGFYVDDLVTGEGSTGKALELYSKTKDRMSQGGFNMRKWLTNSKVLKDKIDLEEKKIDRKSDDKVDDNESYAKVSLGMKGTESKCHKVLGQVWDNDKDDLKFEVAKTGEKARTLSPTKRNLLSVLASLFDPIGIVSPIIVYAKILFQEVCKAKIDWDETFTGEILKKWEVWYKDLIEANEIITPRCIYDSPEEEVLECTLHGFGDASQKAYCALVYFVYQTSVGVYVRLLTSKARVAPLKPTTIPRLELMSARLLAQLMKSVKDALTTEVKIDYTWFWLDSITALYWIRNRGEWKQFVHHRVNEILKLTNKEEWGHCPGVENPADIGSRGILASNLKVGKLWWEGPDWLSKPKEEWPKFKCNGKRPETIEEERKPVVMLVQVNQQGQATSGIDINKYSTSEHLFRVTAQVLRFKFNSQARVKNKDKRIGDLSVEELVDAESVWIKKAQAELKAQRNYDQLSKSLRLEEEEGILRCKGRLKNSDLELSAKYPIILPKDHRLTELLVRKTHNDVYHCGVRATLCRLRSKYWIVKGRQMVKRIVGKCVTCKRLEGKSYSEAPVSDLPGFRVRQTAPFSKVGIDFAGPLFVKGCAECSSKVYIALFSCCVTRAIHLELVRDLSAETFLRSLRRFAARRGTPSLIVSDNAKTFKAAERALRKLYSQQRVRNELQTKRITWRFNLERAPWWGGVFERMVRSVKRCLRKTLGNARLTFDELDTVLVEVEGTLNARPLTDEYEEFDGEVLTPSHLIYGRAINIMPQNEVAEGENSCEERFKYVSLKLDHFWKRWQKEYLTGLREFHKCRNGGRLREVKRGDVVTVYGEGAKRCSWKLAVVEELIVSKDKEVRGAKVKVAGKGRPVYLNRPIQKLFPLEVQARPGGNGQEGETPEIKSDGSSHVLHDRPRRAAAEISKAKTKAMLDS